VEVKGAWVRATVQGQKATGAFMRSPPKTAPPGARRVAGGRRHRSARDEDGRRRHEDARRPGLDLPAGKTVELKPGGYHVMLMDLKAPLAKDSTVPLTLVFKDAKGAESKLSSRCRWPPPGSPAAQATAKAGMHKH
jgi:hypothetical protein